MVILPDQSGLRFHVLDERFYKSPTDDDKFYPGVTEILRVFFKSWKDEWLKNVGHNAEIISKKARERGSAVHKLIELFLTGNEVNFDFEDENSDITVWECLRKFMQFYYRYRPKILAVEKVLSSDKYGFGGTLDILMELHIDAVPEKFRGVWLVDNKTGTLSPEGIFQQAAYRKLLKEYNQDVDHVGLMHLDSNHRKVNDLQGVGWKLVEIPEEKLVHGWKMFLTARQMWRHHNPNYVPKNKTYPAFYKIDEEPDKETMELIYAD